MERQGPAAELLTGLQDPALYDHPVSRFEILETHISWILLTGHYAYKIKKPVDLGFVNFASLARRRFYCLEELRLNRRLAPQLYLDMVRITGSPTTPQFDGAGPDLEYAVRMLQFDQSQRLDRVLAAGRLTPGHVRQLARDVAAFHGRIPHAPEEESYGLAVQVHKPVQANFDQLRAYGAQHQQAACLTHLQTWSDARFHGLAAVLDRRRYDGFVRECHGDMHLANMVLLDGEVVVFDCIEFNPELRWIDVMSEIAFLVMDLSDRGRPGLANVFLNEYLQWSGDHAGLAVLPYYLVYRALVRAKVGAIRWGQTGLEPAERNRIAEEIATYLDLAGTFTRRPRPSLLITHGLAGSGKSVLSEQLAQALGAIRIRSDVERKRLYGHEPLARTSGQVDSGIYTAEASVRTYDALARAARTVLQAGFPVLVDATFLQRDQRARFRELAWELDASILVLHCHAPVSVLQQRVNQRAAAGNDPSEADAQVLARQLAKHEPLAAEEGLGVLSIDTTTALNTANILRRIAEHCGMPYAQDEFEDQCERPHGTELADADGGA